MRAAPLFVFSIIICANALAQDVGSWWMYWGSNKLSDRFGVWTEAQYRDFGFFKGKDQLLLRTGVEYYLKSNQTITGGYAFIKDWPQNVDQTAPTTENRIWQQFNWVNNPSRWQLQHRFRLEQRWIDRSGEVTYANRFRYRLLALFPISRPVMGDKTLFFAAYNEIMFGFGRESGFDQNRLYGALGYRFSPLWELQTGYLFQTFSSGTVQRFQLAMVYNLDFRH